MHSKNKQTLLQFKKQKKVVKKSRKLLDEKLNGLIKAFRESVIEGYKLEEEVKQKSGSIVGKYMWATSFVSSKKLKQFSISNLKDTTTSPYELKADNKKYFGIKIPTLELVVKPLNLSNKLKPVLSKSITDFNQKLPLFVKLIQARIKSQILADEIIKTNRLIANIDIMLEKITIDINKITAYLMEKENETKAILIKLFN